MEARFTFDNGIAVQFAQYILSRDRRRWAFIEQGCKITLCELATALREYHSFTMGNPIDFSSNTCISLSRIVGFEVRDLSQEQPKQFIALFYQSLARFYEETIIPYYLNTARSREHLEEDRFEINHLRRLTTPIV